MQNSAVKFYERVFTTFVKLCFERGFKMWQIYKRLPVTFGKKTQQMVTEITNTGEQRRINELLNLPLLQNNHFINYPGD